MKSCIRMLEPYDVSEKKWSEYEKIDGFVDGEGMPCYFINCDLNPRKGDLIYCEFEWCRVLTVVKEYVKGWIEIDVKHIGSDRPDGE